MIPELAITVLTLSDKFLREIYLCKLCESNTGRINLYHKFLSRQTLLCIKRYIERINKFINRPILTNSHNFSQP